MNTNPRQIEIFCKEEKREWWEPANAEMVNSGDVFRMFEPDGTPVVDERGLTEWRCIKQPEIVTTYTEPWAVDCGFPAWPMHQSRDQDKQDKFEGASLGRYFTTFAGSCE